MTQPVIPYDEYVEKISKLTPKERVDMYVAYKRIREHAPTVWAVHDNATVADLQRKAAKLKEFIEADSASSQ